jgi:hypothetical protein
VRDEPDEEAYPTYPHPGKHKGQRNNYRREQPEGDWLVLHHPLRLKRNRFIVNRWTRPHRVIYPASEDNRQYQEDNAQSRIYN